MDKLFTELRFKKSDEIHDSGFRCIEVYGYNQFTKEDPVLLSLGADIIHIPVDKYASGEMNDLSSGLLVKLAIDIPGDADYFRLFLKDGSYRIKSDGLPVSDFMFSIVKVGEVS